jgi:hypothetical protein
MFSLLAVTALLYQCILLVRYMDIKLLWFYEQGLAMLGQA